jgi:hypothetical protein
MGDSSAVSVDQAHIWQANELVDRPPIVPEWMDKPVKSKTFQLPLHTIHLTFQYGGAHAVIAGATPSLR